LGKLQKEAEKEGFWDDSRRAGMIMKQIENIKEEGERWKDIQNNADGLLEFLEIIDEDGEDDLKTAKSQFEKTLKKFKLVETETLYNGVYDKGDAVVSIHAGAGGDDAQDWAAMILRMFLRYCEKKKYKVNILSETKGSEAGIKSIMFEVDGKFAYGNFTAEAGVHRLVRLSPFNSDNLRQTSFALVEAIPLIEDDAEIEVDSSDLKIDTFRSSGAGGQSVNTTDSAVRVTHLPTNTVVSCQNERSQLQNKEKAIKILKSKLFQKQEKERLENEKKLKGEHISAEWGSQIRSYVLHPYKMVKDHRTSEETTNVEAVLDGELDVFIEKFLKKGVR
jgi:peptide chain release factor 2